MESGCTQTPAIVQVLEPLFAVAVLTDDVAQNGRSENVDAVNAVADQIIHGKPAARDECTTVMALCMSCIVELHRPHQHDPAGNRWTDEQLEGGHALLLRLAGAEHAAT